MSDAPRFTAGQLPYTRHAVVIDATTGEALLMDVGDDEWEPIELARDSDAEGLAAWLNEHMPAGSTESAVSLATDRVPSS